VVCFPCSKWGNDTIPTKPVDEERRIITLMRDIWPPTGPIEQQEVVVPAVSQLISIRGACRVTISGFTFTTGRYEVGGLAFSEPVSLEEWRQMGYDRHSVVADPLFVDPDNDDYRLKPDSPALELGFQPIDVGRIGIRKQAP